MTRAVRCAAIAVLLGVGASPAAAQAPATGFLTRADLDFTWANLAASDRRFDWRGLIGFDVDLADYGAGRLRFRGDYEAVLGRERRRYDLNSGTYRFEVSASRRIGAVEVAAISQHVSRHLVDRQNAPAISWNTAGARMLAVATIAGWRSHASIDWSHAMQQAYVDYRWFADLRVASSHPLRPGVDAIVRASGSLAGVDRRVVDRKRQCGASFDGGVRITGHAAALELFAGYERRIDAFPTDRGRARWFTMGFRLITAQ